MGNSLSQNLSVLPAPSGREPLARWETLHFSRELCRPGSHPFRLAASRQATFPKGTAFGGGGKVSGIAIRRPLGGAGALAPEGVQAFARSVCSLCSQDGRGNSPAAPAGVKTVWKTTVYACFPHRVFLPGGLWKTARGEIPDWRKANP